MKLFAVTALIVLDDVSQCSACRWNDGSFCEIFNQYKQHGERCRDCITAEWNSVLKDAVVSGVRNEPTYG
jgi:hypothetical protein